MRYFLTLAITVSTFAQTPDPARQSVHSFYEAYSRSKFDGLPDKSQLARVEKHLSSTLAAAARTAQARQTACLKRRPDEKGPWAEGDLFSSNFEGFTRFQIATSPMRSTATRREYTIEFQYTENGRTFSWKDNAVVTLEHGRWLLDDVIYRRQEGFTSGFGANLKQSLTTDPGCR